MKKILLTLFLSLTIYGQTIKDISNVVGIRDNQLIGNGLVVGLKDGDGSELTGQMLKNLMQNSFLNSSVSADGAAAVIVTASLPAFARQGDKIKVEVSSIAGGTNLDGGQLILTQLKGIDGKVYAIAQGKIMGNMQGRKTKQEAYTGYIYDGATIENELGYSLRDEKFIKLSLLEHDAKIALLCEDKINEKFGKNIALAYDTRTIEIKKPDDMSIVRFISEIQNIEIDSMMKKKVIIDTRKGIIVAGADIIISPVTITRGDFIIRIKKSNLDDKAWADPAVNKGENAGDDVKIEALGDLETEPIVVNFNNSLVNAKEQPTISDLMRAMKMMKLGIAEIIETIKMLDKLGAIDANVELVR